MSNLCTGSVKFLLLCTSLLMLGGCSGTSTSSKRPAVSPLVKTAQSPSAEDASANDMRAAFAAGFTPTSSSMPTAAVNTIAPRPSDEIAPGNLVEIRCLQDEKINGRYRVGLDGVVTLPYDVRVTIADSSTEAARQAVANAYRGFFRGQPVMSVQIVERKYLVRAAGLVDKPGEYLVSDGGSIDELIGLAGGLQKGSDQRPLAQFARLKSNGGEEIIKLADYYSGNAARQNWRGGETVFFQSVSNDSPAATGVNKRYVQVMGQVRSPGEYLFRENSNFLYYLVQAGGPTDRANVNNLVLMRDDSGKVTSVPFSMNEPEKIPVIQGGDVVIVQAENRTEFERGTSIFSSIGSVLAAMATAVLIGVGL